MSEKHVVVQGATCECNYGFTPDSIKVISHQNEYANDSTGSQKLIATTKDVGVPLQAGTFGQCKLQPTSSGYKPCKPSITGWDNYYKDVVLKNGGNIILEDSQAICAISGSPCIKITNHGQVAEPSQQNMVNVDDDIQAQLNPHVNPTEVQYTESEREDTENREIPSEETEDDGATDESPTNLTPLTVGEPDENLEAKGILKLSKLEVETDFVISNDYLFNLNTLSLDENNYWVLIYDGNAQYHWLEEKLREEDDDNKKKPSVIPVIVIGDEPFKFKVTCKIVIPSDNFKIRVLDSSGNYEFEEPNKEVLGEELITTFTSSNTPFANTVKYFENFQLNFEYSFDEENWIPMGTIPLEVHIPWKNPDSTYKDLEGSVKFSYNDKKVILETLIWLGCKYGNDVGNDSTLNADGNEEQILDAVFTAFEDKKVYRRRETENRIDGTGYLMRKFPIEGMGYWRGASSVNHSELATLFRSHRNLRFLLTYGEARCGEWTRFFQNIILCLGINIGSDSVAICTKQYSQGFKYFETSPNFVLDKKSHTFAVKNAMLNDLNNPGSTTGNSPGQGNATAQPFFVDHVWFFYTKKRRFFDASYGKSYNTADSNLTNYCADNISSIFLEELNVTTSPPTPTGVGRIETTNIHNYICSDKELF